MLFAVEVQSYAVMSNRLHVVVRTLPQRVAGWDDEEVARRWLWIFPGRGGKPGRPPEQDAIRAFCRNRREGQAIDQASLHGHAGARRLHARSA